MKLLKRNLQIAIDGPSGSGKSLLAKLLSRKLGIFYFNTGATFRAVALLASKEELDFEDKELIQTLQKVNLSVCLNKKGFQILMGGKDVTGAIFSRRLDWGASCVAILPEVRKILIRKWQEVTRDKAVVIEGRDIAKVFPRADLKIYLTASLEIRAKRIWTDLIKKGIRKSYQEVVKQVEKRDYQDVHRKVNPLELSKQYWILDNSKLAPEEEVELVIDKLREIKLVS